MRSTEKLVYRNELQQEVELSLFSVYILQRIEEEVASDIVENKPLNKDGYTYISSTLGKRDINIQGVIKLNNNIDILERRLRAVFSPKLSGTLIYRSAETEKIIEVRPEEIVEFKRAKGVSSFNIPLSAFSPFWKEVEKTEYLALLSGKLTFPLIIPQNSGIMFGRRQSILETEIENVGDVSSGFRVVFRAKGIVSNPEIENKLTGEKIRLIVDMDKGDIVEIVNQPLFKMVYVNGVRSFKSLDRHNANFFKLEVGKNLVGYSAELNAVNLDVIVYYSPLYLGRQ